MIIVGALSPTGGYEALAVLMESAADAGVHLEHCRARRSRPPPSPADDHRRLQTPCALSWLRGSSIRITLVVAANRDEFFARPTAAAAPYLITPTSTGAGPRGGRHLARFIPLRGRFWPLLTNVREPETAGRSAPAVI